MRAERRERSTRMPKCARRAARAEGRGRRGRGRGWSKRGLPLVTTLLRWLERCSNQRPAKKWLKRPLNTARHPPFCTCPKLSALAGWPSLIKREPLSRSHATPANHFAPRWARPSRRVALPCSAYRTEHLLPLSGGSFQQHKSPRFWGL